MGKRKRRENRDYDDDLYQQIKKLKKSLKKKRKGAGEIPTPTDNQTVSITEPTPEQMAEVEAIPEQMVEVEPVPQQMDEVEPVPEYQIEIEPDELLNDVLGEDPTKTNKYGADTHNDIASRWEHIAKEGLQKDLKNDILKTVLIPENCKFLEAPVINPEIKAAISDPVYKRDRVLVAQQTLLGQATACIAVALSDMLKDKDRNIKTTKTISNAGRIMCELFHTQSQARRSLIQFALNKETKDIVIQTKIEKQLFGDNLSEALKAGKAIYKTGSEIRYSKPPTEKPNLKQNSSLNYRGPPRKQQQRPPAPSAGRATNTKQPNKHAPQRPSTQKTRSYRHRR